nr:glycosyltransferase 87 family protein [uncultured Butyrivibrio sp.]
MAKETNKTKLIPIILIIALVVFNIFLHVSRTIPTTLDYSIDLRYNRVKDLLNHTWAGVEEFPSMLFCMFPIALFPDMQAARLGWMIANFAFSFIIMFCLKATLFHNISSTWFIVITLFFTSSVPVATAIMNGQNLLFSLAFFMMAYALSSADDNSGYGAATTNDALYFNNSRNKAHLVRSVVAATASSKSSSSGVGSFLLSILAGLLLGISYFKYSTIFFLVPIFIYKRKWIELITSAILHIALNIFAIFWLNTSLLHIILSPITSSTDTNAGAGFIDIMTMLYTKAGFLGSYTGTVYLIILVAAYLLLLFIAVKRTTNDEMLFFSLCCALSTILIYHRQYDFFVLIVPMYYLIETAGHSFSFKNLSSPIEKSSRILEICALLISLVGIFTVMYLNWIFKYTGVSIEYGLGATIFYECSIIGIYVLCGYLLIKSLLR